MAVKYRLTYKDYSNSTCVLDISHPDYNGTIIPIRGQGKQAVILERECDDDPYEPIVNTKATINVYQEEHNPIDVFELQTAEDREFSVTLTINSQVKFKGWINPDGLQQPYAGSPFALQLTATDGLMMLQDILYEPYNLTGGRCIINYFRGILMGANNLGMDMPIKWYCPLKNLEYPLEDDLFSGAMRWSNRGEGFTDYNGNRKDCMYILENMLKSMQCRIVQSNGAWHIFRINDFVSESTTGIVWRQIDNLTGFDITVLPAANVNKSIGDATNNFQLVDNDGTLMVLPALKRVITTYEQDQRDNILPNGNMDIWSSGVLLYWGLLNSDPTAGYVTQEGSLYEDGGFSAEITTLQPNIFRMSMGALPIDTDVLYSYIDFGFKFVITSWGNVDANGLIIWGDVAPFTIQVEYNAGGVYYYLNEFGAWTLDGVVLPIEVPNLKVNDVTQLSFNKNGEISIPLPVLPDVIRETPPSIAVYFNLKPDLIIRFDDVYIKTDTNSDVYESTANTSVKNSAKEEYKLGISSSHNGFYVSNFMTSYAASGVEKFYTDGENTGTLTALNSMSILRNRYLPSLIFEGSIYGSDYSYVEMYSIQGFEGKKFLPLRSSWNTETNTVRLTCVESRNDDISISTSHYGSNDKTKLSN